MDERRKANGGTTRNHPPQQTLAPERVQSFVEKMPGTAGLALIDHLARSTVIKSPEASQQFAMQVVANASSAALKEWLNKNPSSPRRATIEANLNPG